MSEKIHPATPAKLVKKYKQAGSFRKLADERGVNIRFVFELITKGIEPNDTTPLLRYIRRRLYLPSRRKKRPPRELHPVQKAARQIQKETRNQIKTALQAARRADPGDTSD